jgi:taurine dioxygenase
MSPADLERLEAAKRNNPPVTHPVVRTHPVSKRRGLFVQEGFTTHINELSADESRALLRFLYQHSIRPEFTVRWQWREGDVAFWDNRNTLHYATDDYRPARRVMHRATIMGDRPA